MSETEFIEQIKLINLNSAQYEILIKRAEKLSEHHHWTKGKNIRALKTVMDNWRETPRSVITEGKTYEITEDFGQNSVSFVDDNGTNNGMSTSYFKLITPNYPSEK